MLKAHRSGTPIRDQGSDRDHVITISCGTGWSETEWLSQPHFNLFTASACLLLDRGEHVRRPEEGLGPHLRFKLELSAGSTPLKTTANGIAFEQMPVLHAAFPWAAALANNLSHSLALIFVERLAAL